MGRSSDGKSRSAGPRACPAKWRSLAGAGLLTAAVAGCSYLNTDAAAAPDGAASSATILSQGKTISSGQIPQPIAVAIARGPKPGPRSASSGPLTAAEHAGSLLLNASGATLKTWNATSSYCPQSTGYLGDGKVATDSSGAVTLTTTRSVGSCAALISPDAYASVVLESYFYLPPLPGKPGTLANWDGIWMTDGAAWPEDGELDAVEVEPLNGQNAVNWHSGTSAALFSISTSGFVARLLPKKGPNLTSGWHTVDAVYTKGYFAVYYDGRLFTSYTSANVTGSPLNLYVTTSVTPDNSAVRSELGGPPSNSDTSSPVFAVRYLRAWSYR
ncbi:MAG TPA: glycoside hydrolase family 16 protein [Trebonia sp.]